MGWSQCDQMQLPPPTASARCHCSHLPISLQHKLLQVRLSYPSILLLSISVILCQFVHYPTTLTLGNSLWQFVMTILATVEGIQEKHW